MAQRNPTLEDIQLPNIGGPRPVASIDPSGWGRGAQAIAQAGQAIGKDVQSIASDVTDYTNHMQMKSVENGLMDLSTSYINNRNQFSLSNDPQDLANWQNANQDARNRFNSAVSNVGPALGTHAAGKAGLMDAEENFRITERRHQLDTSQAEADTLQDIEGLRTVGPPNLDGHPDPTMEGRIDGVNGRIDQRLANGHLSPEKAQVYKQHAIATWVDAQISGAIAAGNAEPDPDKAEVYFRHAADLMGRGVRSRVGAPAPAGVAGVVSRAETGDASIGPKALGNISPDSNGSKSYGFMGLNSASGSAAAFVRGYGGNLGITARPGTPAFDAQWKAAATNQTAAFRNAQLQYFNNTYVASVSADLQRYGVPENIANDPRVQTYFTDRKVQMDTIGLGAATRAWQTSGGDVPAFLRNMNAIDGSPANLQRNFRSAIDTGVYGPAGHATRLATRLNGALAATGQPQEDQTTQPPAQDNTQQHPLAPIAQQALSPEKLTYFSRTLESARNAKIAEQGRIQRAQEQARKDAANDLYARAFAGSTLTGKSPLTPTEWISMGPAGSNEIDQATVEKGIELWKAINNQSADTDEKKFGPGYSQAFTDIVSGNMKDKGEISTRFLSDRGSLFPAGVRRLQEDWDNQYKKTQHEFSLNKDIDSALAYAKNKMVLEDDFGAGPRIRNPEGFNLYTSTFVHTFLDRLDQAREANKGIVPKEFWDRKNIDALVNEIYPSSKKNAELVAYQPSGDYKEEPNAPLPPVPEGATPEGWKAVMTHTPPLKGGAPMSHQLWSEFIGDLLANPSPQVMAAFDKHFGEAGFTAAQILQTLNPAAARSLEMTAKSAAQTFPPVQSLEETGPPLDHGAHAQWRDDQTFPPMQSFEGAEPRVSVTPEARVLGAGEGTYEERRAAAIAQAKQQYAERKQRHRESALEEAQAANESAMRAGGSTTETPEQIGVRLQRERLTRIEQLKQEEKDLLTAQKRSPLGNVAALEIARVRDERAALEKQVIPARVEPPRPQMKSPTVDDRLTALDYREYTLKRSGLKGAFFDAQMKRITDQRKQLQAAKENR